MAGQIVGNDIKTEAELLLDGFGPDSLPKTEQIYDSNLAITLDEIIAGGYMSRSGVIGTVGAPQSVSTQIDLTSKSTHGVIDVFVTTAGGNVNITLADIVNGGGFAGQKLNIYGTSDVNTVTITDGHNGPITFMNKTIAEYFYNGAAWIEKGRNS